MIEDVISNDCNISDTFNSEIIAPNNIYLYIDKQIDRQVDRIDIDIVDIDTYMQLYYTILSQNTF